MKRPQGRPPKGETYDVPSALVKAAQQHLMQSFTDEIKVTDLASDAGVNPSMINYYFGSKSGLFISVLEEPLTKFCRQLRNLALDEYEPEALLETVIAMTDQHVCDTAYLRTMSVREMAETTTEIHEAYKSRIGPQVQRTMTKVLTRVYAAYPDCKARAHIAAYTILATSVIPLFTRNYFASTFLMAPDGEDRIAFRKMLANLLAPCGVVPKPAGCEAPSGP